MLSNLIDIQATAYWRAGSSLAALDAGLPGGVRVTSLHDADLCGTGAFMTARPRTAQGALMPGLRPTSAPSKQDTGEKYQHATRVAANSGNASGSHPASWDPV